MTYDEEASMNLPSMYGQTCKGSLKPLSEHLIGSACVHVTHFQLSKLHVDNVYTYVYLKLVSVWHGNYFDHLLDWEREIEAHPNHAIFVSNFEDMKRVSDSIRRKQKRILTCMPKLSGYARLKTLS